MLRPSILLGLVLLASLQTMVASRSVLQGVPQGYPVNTNNQSDPSSPPFCAGVQLDDLVYKSFTIKPAVLRPGGIVRMYATFDFNRWPTGATSMYCAIRNYNLTASGGGANFAIQNRDQTFPRQKYGVNYQVALSESVDGKIEWIFNRLGEDLQTGHTWTLMAKIKLNKNTKLNSVTWRAYCETKQPAPLVSWYYFKSWITMDIIQGGAGGSGSKGSKSPRNKANRNKSSK